PDARARPTPARDPAPPTPLAPAHGPQVAPASAPGRDSTAPVQATAARRRCRLRPRAVRRRRRGISGDRSGGPVFDVSLEHLVLEGLLFDNRLYDGGEGDHVD